MEEVHCCCMTRDHTVPSFRPLSDDYSLAVVVSLLPAGIVNQIAKTILGEYAGVQALAYMLGCVASCLQERFE